MGKSEVEQELERKIAELEGEITVYSNPPIRVWHCLDKIRLSVIAPTQTGGAVEAPYEFPFSEDGLVECRKFMLERKFIDPSLPPVKQS